MELCKKDPYAEFKLPAGKNGRPECEYCLLLLDISFREDESRKRDGYVAQNFSMLNRIARNLIKHKQSKKRSVNGKRPDAGWNNDYLLKILTN